MSSSPLRSDAARNRERILAAASELFAQEGAHFCVDEIASRAGVGHATVFRRFPTKDDLVIAMLEERLDRLARDAEAAEALEDPWDGLRAAMELIAARQACDKGLFETISSEAIGSPRLREARHRLVAPFARLLRRAQAAGAVREDIEPEDVLLLAGAAAHATPCRLQLGDLWRRYLGIVFDGMRPDGASPLSPPPPRLAELEAALEAVSARSDASSSS